MSEINPKEVREAIQLRKQRHQEYLNSLPVIVKFRFWYPKDSNRQVHETWIMAKDLQEAEAYLYKKVGLVNIIEFDERVCRVHDITSALAKRLYKMWKSRFEPDEKEKEVQ